MNATDDGRQPERCPAVRLDQQCLREAEHVERDNRGHEIGLGRWWDTDRLSQDSREVTSKDANA